MDAGGGAPVVKEGWLWKRGGNHGGRSNWKRRWFVLLGDTLYYMESRTERSVRGRIELRGCDFRIVEDELKRGHSFSIYNLEDMRVAPFFCAAESAEEMEDWISWLRDAAQGLFKFSPSTDGAAALEALMLIERHLRDYLPRHLPQAELEVTVVEARDLAAMDYNGRSDPYCVLHCGQSRFKTACIPRTLNPRWGETFRLELVPGAGKVQLDLYDHDLFTHDDFLGTVALAVEDLLDESVGAHAGQRGIATDGTLTLASSRAIDRLPSLHCLRRRVVRAAAAAGSDARQPCERLPALGHQRDAADGRGRVHRCRCCAVRDGRRRHRRPQGRRWTRQRRRRRRRRRRRARVGRRRNGPRQHGQLVSVAA